MILQLEPTVAALLIVLEAPPYDAAIAADRAFIAQSLRAYGKGKRGW